MLHSITHPCRLSAKASDRSVYSKPHIVPKNIFKLSILVAFHYES